MTTRANVVSILADCLGVRPDLITDEASIVVDLGADSLDEVELIMAIEEDFGLPAIPVEEEERLVEGTVGELVAYVEGRVGA